MIRFEYKVRPAPAKGRKGAGIKGPEARFAHALELVMNEMGAEGWEYVRSDILPSEERQGLTSSHTVYRSVLVFRRPLDQGLPDVFDTPPAPQSDAATPEPEIEPAPDAELPEEVIEAVETPEGDMPKADDQPDSPTRSEDDPDDTPPHLRPV
ncbi:MAG: DUF4177 domain-containing protein [Roseovarius sp.]